MNAEDTVMSQDSIEEVKYLEIRDNPDYVDLRLPEKRIVEDGAIARRQAEISFKAGIKDVTDWLSSPCPHTGGLEEQISYVQDCPKCWQVKYREWGMEES